MPVYLIDNRWFQKLKKNYNIKDCCNNYKLVSYFKGFDMYIQSDCSLR